MIITTLKHAILEQCIKTLFNTVSCNFTQIPNVCKTSNLTSDLVGKEISHVFHPDRGILFPSSRFKNDYYFTLGAFIDNKFSFVIVAHSIYTNSQTLAYMLYDDEMVAFK